MRKVLLFNCYLCINSNISSSFYYFCSKWIKFMVFVCGVVICYSFFSYFNTFFIVISKILDIISCGE